MTVSGYHVYMSCGAYRDNGWFINVGGFHFVNQTMGMPHTNFMRTIQSSSNGVFAMYDMELHTDSAAIADGSWTHYVAAISNSALVNYVDGVAVSDSTYGLYGDNGDTHTVQNSAIPTLSSLRFEMDSYDFDDQPIILGARASFDREFGGAMAGFTIYQDAVDAVSVGVLHRGQLSTVIGLEPFSPRTMPGCEYLVHPTPTYDWVDITSSGTRILPSDWTSAGTNNTNSSADDDGWYEVPLPFQFPFYGFLSESTLNIGTNGYITFGTDHFPYGNSYELPHAASLGGVAVDGMLAVFWTDINPGAAADGCGVWYEVSEERAVVSYICVPYWTTDNSPDPHNTFQVIFYPNGVIHMNYLDLQQGGASHGTPSIGIETAEGDVGISLAYGWPNVPADGTALELVPDETSCPCGEVPYSDCAAQAVCISSISLPG